MRRQQSVGVAVEIEQIEIVAAAAAHAGDHRTTIVITEISDPADAFVFLDQLQLAVVRIN